MTDHQSGAVSAERELLAELADPEWHGECRYDHHGYCQEHGYMATDPPCPYARARALLADPPRGAVEDGEGRG